MFYQLRVTSQQDFSKTTYQNIILCSNKFLQLKKYQKRRNPLNLNYLWLIIIMIIVVFALLAVFFILPGVMGSV